MSEPEKFEVLAPLRAAVATGDAAAIRGALPEPPTFLQTVFRLTPSERDALLGAVLPVLETDEDTWEIIEAAVMDTIARPERGAFLAIIKYVPASLLDDARRLVTQLRDPQTQRAAQQALAARAAALTGP